MSVIVIYHNSFLELEIKARFIKRWYVEKILVIVMHPEGEKKKKTTKPQKTVITFQSAFGDNSGEKISPKENL